MTEPCRYEVNIALMESSLKCIENSVKDLAYLLRGNGEIGLKGKAERHWVAIRALFWINGAIAVTIMGVILDHLFYIRPVAKVVSTTLGAPEVIP